MADRRTNGHEWQVTGFRRHTTGVGQEVRVTGEQVQHRLKYVSCKGEREREREVQGLKFAGLAI